MAIRNDRELEAAVQEYQKLRNAPEGTDSAGRRECLNADIQTYYHQNQHHLRPAKPPDTPVNSDMPEPPYTPADPDGTHRGPGEPGGKD